MIQAVIFDWAGTLIDYGSFAPVQVIRTVFSRRGISVTPDQARQPMGKAKREHLATVFQMPDILQAWQEIYRREPEDSDIEQMYQEFLPLQATILQENCELIPGVLGIVQELHRRGVSIASTTGYTKDLMRIVETCVLEQGLRIPVMRCADDVPQGRPKPWMIFQCLQALDCYPAWRSLVVDDTLVGVAAGKNAGCWTVGVRKSGNELGLTWTEVNRLDPKQLHSKLATIEQRFLQAGADFVIDSVADLLPVLDTIEQRMALGEKP